VEGDRPVWPGRKKMHKVAAVVLVLAVMFLAGCEKGNNESQPIGGGPPAPASLDAQKEIDTLKGVLKEDPQNLRTLIRLGNISMDSGQFQQAVDAYGRALQVDPANIDVRVDMGTCYRRMGMPEKAAETYRKAIEMKPSHAVAHLNLGIVLAYDLNKPGEAVTEFETYLKLAPSAPNADAVKQEIAKWKAVAG
jgi:cytochrome c-type biogenesis protein CcmH/NrfG